MRQIDRSIETEAVVVVDLRLALFAVLGSDEYHAERSAGAVDR